MSYKLGLFLAVFTCFLFQTNDVFATTCTFSGNTIYCSDPGTGKTTTYNQYGDNIYGSDGSSATIHYDPVYGSGSGLPPVSTAGADMNSPEMKEAQARYEEACQGMNNSGEVLIGGAQATNCRNATADWLRALGTSQRSNTPSFSEPEIEYSNHSDSSNGDLDTWTKKLLSDFGITNGGSQSEVSCVPNSHVAGSECTCDSGYFNNFKQSCVPLTNQNCTDVYGEGAEASYRSNLCVCKIGYATTDSKVGCVPNFTTSNNSEVNRTFLGQPKKAVRDVPNSLETVRDELKNNTSEPIRMTRAEYEAKYDVPAPTVDSTKSEAEKISWWKRILNWFSWFGF